ncbi:2-oxoglutarate and iron-dependent oxygenase JMJD4 [Cylas formicarius]|uniref:2-oxoglutarate and iron-dependent oxygenase JMJD4 n=1 Tax=Cylas formicarius TaxID=197179 RepID=UPI00295844CF|nr:2-oxoglutarate and iron-dependent oxygenase JMJD4 [Cylas formicarius]
MEFEIDVCENVDNRKDANNVIVLRNGEVSYNHFFHNMLQANVPCIIRNVTENWEASSKWVENKVPNINYLEEKYGSLSVCVYNCSQRFFNSQKSNNDILKNYLNYWNKERNNKCLYLKDWHLKLQSKSDEFYKVPIYFGSDWLNEYYIKCENDDYRFVYLGPKNSWTPFHADVFTSYSWSANVCGQKKWLILPPGEENRLKDNFGNLPYDISNMRDSINCMEVIQNPGEAIFIPSGWYHQVWNLEDTISINHNWFNGCNILTVWESLNHNLSNVIKEIEHCKEMEDFENHCQVMLNALFGMDHKKFLEILKFIALSRVDMLRNKALRVLFHGHIIGINHILFDLKQIKFVLEQFLNCDLNFSSLFVEDNVEDILNKIYCSLES